MAVGASKPQKFNVVIVAQQGRLMYEALLFAASLRAADPQFAGRLIVAEPAPGGAWGGDVTIRNRAVRDLLEGDYGAEILPFEARHFGAAYPQGNKIEALLALPEGEPFVFFDSDTLICGALSAVPFDFDRPGASQRVEGTWPQPQLYRAGYGDIWKSLYDRFGLDFESSLDLSQPDEYWRRYLYFNAGWFFYRCPREFGRRYLDWALEVRRDPGPALAAQVLEPWLDQVVLPLVVHSLGGGRDVLPAGLLDGAVSCHWRTMPLLFARESDAVVAHLRAVAAPNRLKKVLKQYEPMLRFIYQKRGDKVRAMFDRDALPRREQMIRNRIKKAGLWMR